MSVGHLKADVDEMPRIGSGPRTSQILRDHHPKADIYLMYSFCIVDRTKRKELNGKAVYGEKV